MIKNLQSLGLYENEAKMYLALLENGECSAGLLSKRTLVNRTTTYDALDRLLEKGLVSYVIQSGKRIFQATSPSHLLVRIKDQERVAKNVIPKLTKIRANTTKESSTIYKGRKGIRSILQDILTHKTHVSFGSSGGFLEVMKHDFYWFQARKKEIKVKSRVLLPMNVRKKRIATTPFADIRFVPDSLAAPTSTWVFGNKVAIVAWSQTPTATVIESKEIAKRYKAHFEFLWKQAKKSSS